MSTIIIKPLITEKSMSDAAHGKYTFVVTKAARKPAIKQAVKQQFNVTVSHVATTVIKGRTQRTGIRRIEVGVSPLKKATVTLKKGDKIGLFEPGGGEPEEKKEKKK